LDSLTIRRVPIDSLHQDPANARVHDERNLAVIKASLTRFGQQTPLVVDARNIVRKGNGTLQAAKALGWSEIDVVVTDLQGVEATAYSVADNRSSDLSEFDDKALAATLQALAEDGGLDGIGFDEKEIQALLDEIASQELVELGQDEAPGLPDEATTRPGDLWILGNHRLLCGDSSKREDVDRLLDGARIQLVNTDPPYNVKVEPRSNNAIAAGLSSFAPTHHQKLDVERHPAKAKATHEKLRPKDRPLANDFVSDEAFDKLLRAWFGNIAYALEDGRAAYIWGGYANCANYPSALKESGLYFSQSIIWVKEHPVLTRKDFMGNHEWCFYSWKEGAAHVFLGPNNASDVWSVKKLHHASMVHLTEKPVELAARALQYSSRPGENVLDLFGGSGSTLIACEQLGRKGYLLELDALYADVIVERWQNLTGKDATLDGKTFSQVRKERLG